MVKLLLSSLGFKVRKVTPTEDERLTDKFLSHEVLASNYLKEEIKAEVTEFVISSKNGDISSEKRKEKRKYFYENAFIDGVDSKIRRRHIGELHTRGCKRHSMHRNYERMKKNGIKNYKVLGIHPKSCTWCQSVSGEVFPISYDFPAMVDEKCKCELYTYLTLTVQIKGLDY